MYRESHKDVKEQLYSKIECIFLKTDFKLLIILKIVNKIKVVIFFTIILCLIIKSDYKI